MSGTVIRSFRLRTPGLRVQMNRLTDDQPENHFFIQVFEELLGKEKVVCSAHFNARSNMSAKHWMCDWLNDNFPEKVNADKRSRPGESELWQDVASREFGEGA